MRCCSFKLRSRRISVWLFENWDGRDALDSPLRKRKTKNPCATCGLHPNRCICALIPKLNLRTRIALLIHTKELKRTTNSGRLAIYALTNSVMRIRGSLSGPAELSDLLSSEYESYVLYPSDDAMELDRIRPTKPVQLIVSDGNWRQASKINTRHPELSHLPRVKVNRPNLASFHLRKEHFGTGFSTLEAIALALTVTEGEKVGETLMALYRAKLNATLRGRGVDLEM
jgi:DTW domain-containing protein YfiP